MAYVAEWERLADARKRVMATGVAKSEAEHDLCAAMSDGKIKVRPHFELIKRTILDHQIARKNRAKIFDFMRALRDGVHQYPPPWDSLPAFSMKGVTPRQLEWRKSHFRNPWSVPIHPEMGPMEWEVSIELAGADVTRVLIGAPSGKPTTSKPHADSTPREMQPQAIGRRQQWRAARIERFRERQRRAREWINFAEIAEWCSKEDQSIVPNKEKGAAAFDTLASDLLSGEFDERGRSRVFYLHPSSSKTRMTREWLKDVIDHNYDGAAGRSAYLAHCWIESSMFVRWLTKHRLQPSPFRPEKNYHVPAAMAADETAAIRALALQLRCSPEMTRREAARWCKEAGFSLSQRGFQGRVWPRARVRADLKATAPAGRKRKSLR